MSNINHENTDSANMSFPLVLWLPSIFMTNNPSGLACDIPPSASKKHWCVAPGLLSYGHEFVDQGHVIQSTEYYKDLYMMKSTQVNYSLLHDDLVYW